MQLDIIFRENLYLCPIIGTITTDHQAEETDSKTKATNQKLAIDSIFNVETDKIESDDTSNKNLANDFDQYINDLGNKEA